MDLNAIELTEAVTGEAILPPGHYGTDEPEPSPMLAPQGDWPLLDATYELAEHEDCDCHPGDRCAITDHAFVPDPYADECLYSPDGTWATTCYRPRKEHDRQLDDDPYEPVCDTCGGDRYVNIYAGRTTQRHPCPDCVMRGLACDD